MVTTEPLLIEDTRWVVLTPWHNPAQITSFLGAWNVDPHAPTPLLLKRDTHGLGCANMKNELVQDSLAIADAVVILDDDCFPDPKGPGTLVDLILEHDKCLRPQQVEQFLPVTHPISRGTPYHHRSIERKVAASMGFWTHIGDYDALGQLVLGATHPMEFRREIVFGQYFPLCGMNLAFRPKDWLPWCQFIDVPRFDDIWMGWLFQRMAYDLGYCFNLAGPLVKHSRQSNVWQNLKDEARYLEQNETLWSDIATHPGASYKELRALLPV